jgi:hypothetical protein
MKFENNRLNSLVGFNKAKTTGLLHPVIEHYRCVLAFAAQQNS